MPNSPARQPTPTLDAFVEALKPIAMQFGITVIAIAGQDPQTNAQHVYGAPEAVTRLRNAVGEKFGFHDEEISWNDT
jgi:hypothetical protein